MAATLTAPQLAAIRAEYNNTGAAGAQALADSYGYPGSVQQYFAVGTPWNLNPAMGLGDKPISSDTGNHEMELLRANGGTSAVGALTKGAQALSGANQSMLTDFFKDLESRINAGDSASARTRYDQAKTQFGLTDADMQPYMTNSSSGYNFTLPQIQAWDTGWDGSLDANGKPITGATDLGGNPVVKAHDSLADVYAPWETPTVKDQVISGSKQDAVGAAGGPGATGGPGANTNGQVSSGTQTTGGTNSPGVIGNQNATGNTGDNSQFGNNNVYGSYNTDNHSVYNGWGTQGGASAPTSFNTPVLNALYSQQQQNMTSAAPSFNFQAKPASTIVQGLKSGGRVEGALTRVIKGC